MKLKFMLKGFVIALLSFLPLSSYAQGVLQVEPMQLQQLITQKEAPMIIDVRTAEEFNAGHVEGAINIPYDKLEKNSHELDQYKDQSLDVYCQSGRQASRVYQALLPRGFSKLIDLKGHMRLWKQKGLPLVKSIENEKSLPFIKNGQ